ncbi:MAG: aspartate/glutamate racemase family protein [Candidatus Andersenbacteria bacterium]
MAVIGIFDSGYGGLTILHGILKILPQYSYLYLGDNIRAPYGQRSAEEIFKFTKQGVDYLFSHGAQLVILACNTASANALRRIQHELLPGPYPNKRAVHGEPRHRRVLGILVPTIEQITGVSWQKTEPIVSAALGLATVGVLATEQTVRSQAYEHEIHKRNPAIRVIQQACPGLVEAIERGKDKQEIKMLVQHYIEQLYARVPAHAAPISAVLLGCTHYALIADVIAACLPKKVKLYQQPTIVAKSLQQYLKRHPEVAATLGTTGERHFLTTGDEAEVARHSRRYFNQTITFHRVML